MNIAHIPIKWMSSFLIFLGFRFNFFFKNILFKINIIKILRCCQFKVFVKYWDWSEECIVGSSRKMTVHLYHPVDHLRAHNLSHIMTSQIIYKTRLILHKIFIVILFVIFLVDSMAVCGKCFFFWFIFSEIRIRYLYYYIFQITILFLYIPSQQLFKYIYIYKVV